MNPAYDEIIGADQQTRAGLFTTTAERLGTTPQNTEKDFWVCWTLDALFNGRTNGPRLLFKGGTSLSKGFGLIQRFSEDVDVTVFRDDLGQGHSMEELAALSGKKRAATLDDIREACEAYINGDLLPELTQIAAGTSDRTKVTGLKVEPNPKDAQSLLVHYPTATPADRYIEKIVLIESGAKSALDPHAVRPIVPYSNDDVPDLDLTVPNVTVVDAERTYWDKVVILHGIRHWFENKGELRGGGHRVSRHYYDLHMLMQSDIGQRAMTDLALGADCVAHAQMFFNRPAFDLGSARPPTFTLTPEGSMYDDLKRDYSSMADMIFGAAPAFDAIVETVADVERAINKVS
ncbi:nucleotidyl transferase AbiEii/AbiGii toxin family protein [Sphingomonas sabuli]|uniref:Nucleotidyl transferase AbiEii/AbiGii toxin family protein n=1 Tax=Sphingomonas sabuli TaxID=2764186 RepID=A0A7G9L3U8_9SPHN|nr:nucleotidyl transferase AbiEii/AbiGii toxin family protein [Sphingomonas sabuli]QNM83297.1 nucleotidyl transferase AbiEii/AbiGii toxin family protein [Sphingomonas sabuli]